MKNTKLLTKILIILIIIAVTLIAFVGIYTKDKNTTRNLVRENKFGMNIKGYRFVSLNPSTQTEEIYYNSEGKKVEASEANNDEGNLKEGYTKQNEKVNKDEVLTSENYEKMKKIIENRLQRLGEIQYNVKLDKWTGQVIVEIEEDTHTDEVISHLTYKGQFAIIDEETKEVLIDSNKIKNVRVMYSNQEVGTGVYVNIELNAEGKEKLKEITSTYIATTTQGETTQDGESEDETTEKKVTVQVENQDLFSTSFENQITDGILSMTMGIATDDETLSQYIEQANEMATIIGSGETDVIYSVAENFAVSSTIGNNVLKIVLIATVVIVLIGLIFLIIKYRMNGLYACIVYIGTISIISICLKYANVIITLETIVAIYAILIANYILISALLRKVKENKEVDKAFMETMLENLNIIFSLTAIAVVFTFMGWLPVASIGMTLFWGIITVLLTNYLFTKNLIENEDSKE